MGESANSDTVIGNEKHHLQYYQWVHVLPINRLLLGAMDNALGWYHISLIIRLLLGISYHISQQLFLFIGASGNCSFGKVF